jgi:hypothetical protein
MQGKRSRNRDQQNEDGDTKVFHGASVRYYLVTIYENVNTTSVPQSSTACVHREWLT